MKLAGKNNMYLIGIGGIGMSGLAQYFSHKGYRVAGYDRVASHLTEKLQSLGIDIHFEDEVDRIPDIFKDKDSTLIIYTPAIPTQNKELNFFRIQGFEVVKRSEILGRITAETRCLAVAGTHGKTTTSTILAHVMHEAGTGVSAFLGGVFLNIDSNVIIGDGDVTIVEADEFDRSFLKLSPEIACVTSMDADHLDIYGNEQAMQLSFKEFASQVSGDLIVRKGLPLEGKTYGIEDGSDYEAFNIRLEKGNYYFDLNTPKETLEDLTIDLPGKHNVLNTVAALAMADCFGIPLQVIAKALLSFRGIKRRFNYKIKTDNLVLVDDYAHHPTEIDAVVRALREMFPERKLLGIFQPHLFSRTRDFIDQFARSLSGFDELILLEIYPAREEPIAGVNSAWLLSKVTLKNKRISTKERLIKNVRESKADVLAMLGAGDIGELVDGLTENLSVA